MRRRHVALAAVLSTVPIALPLVSAPTVSAAPAVTCTAPSGPPASVSISGGFHGLTPMRLVDTRQLGSTGAVGAECWLRVELPDAVPADATAVALTVTNDRAAAAGYLTVHPCGSALPYLSNVNVRPGAPSANHAVVAVDSTREVCVFSDGGTDVIVDLIGYFAPGGSPFQELAPHRALDTRDPSRRPSDLTGDVVQPGHRLQVSPAALGVPPEATAVMVNLTVTGAEAGGYLTAFPCAGAKPATSSVNYTELGDRANTSIMALSPDGLCLELSVAAAHVIVDVNGWFGGPAGLTYQTGAGRVGDTRDGTGGWNGRFAPGETRPLDPDGTGVLPDDTRVAVLGVTATGVEGAGFLQVRPCGSTAEVSSLNYVPGVDITNLVAVPLDDHGQVCVTSSASTHVVVDVFGGFGAEGLARSLTVGPLTLQPGFRSAQHDYVVYCPEPTGNQLDVAVQGMPGTSVTVGSASGTPSVDTTVTLDANDAVTIVITPPSSPPDEYWIRCLPDDFPQLTVSRPGEPTPGWYLLANIAFLGPAGGNYGMILDNAGVPVWYRKASAQPIDFKRWGDGELAWIVTNGAAIGLDPANAYESFELDGTSTNTYQAVGAPTDHHEMRRLPSGNVLMLSYPVTQSPTAYDCVLQSGAAAQSDQVLGALIEEVDPVTDTVVRSWSADLDGTPKIDIGTGGSDTGETMVPLCFDIGGSRYYAPILVNSLDFDAATGRVIVNARHLDATFAVELTLGGGSEVIWKLGGVETPASLDIIGDPATTDGGMRAHDARLDGDVLTLFDNRTPYTGAPTTDPSRYVSFRIDAGAGTATFIEQLVRSNGDQSGAMGSARAQPDGGVVIGWGALPGPAFQEFDADGDEVLSVGLPAGHYSYRVIKEPIDAFDIEELRQTAGQ